MPTKWVEEQALFQARTLDSEVAVGVIDYREQDKLILDLYQ
jgi:hypothetical protein